jgi:regulator of protease activity HflC (stomatin/prohibitin superfamily)
MITGFFILISLIIAALFLRANITSIKQKDSWVEAPRFWVAIAIFAIGIISSLVQPFTAERVDAGHVGIKVNLTGDNRGISKFEYKTGWVILNSWVSKLYEFPTYQQHIDYPEQQIITKGGFSATIKPSFNYALKPGDVGDMFQNLRLDIKAIEQSWLQTAIVGAVNDVANKWSVDDVFNQRERFESDIVVEANKRVAKWFIISQLRTNITPPQALQQSIEAKTKAIQEVQVAENQRLVAIAEGDRKLAQARADSAALVIKAAGEAEAIRRKQVSLTATYIEYLKTEKWDGKLPTVQAGNSGIILSLPKQ